MRRKITICALVLSLAPTFLGAYEQHLSSTAIREAYFLGRNNDHRTTEFLTKYVHQFPVPKTGPQIAEIEVVTPYAYVVKRAREASVGYSAPLARLPARAIGLTSRSTLVASLSRATCRS